MSVSIPFAGQNIRIPGAYTNINPEVSAAEGLPSLGTVIFIGESDDGMPFDQEEDVASNSFSASSFSQLVAKYKSGRIVDAARFGLAPSNDPRVPGGIQKLYVFKTNDSVRALLSLSDPANYASLRSKVWGIKSNQINIAIATEQAEVTPTTGMFSYMPSTSASVVAYRANGGASATQAVPANTNPTAFAALAFTGLDVSGGAARAIVKASSVGQDSMSLAASGQTATVTLIQGGTGTGVWFANPQAGDTFRIPSGSILAGGGSANVGWYLVTSASNTSVVAYKVTSGAPVAVGSTLVAATTDAEAYEEIEIKILENNNGDSAVIEGAGASLELYDGAGAANINTILLQPALVSSLPAAIANISTSLSPKIIASSAELERLITINRQDNGQTEEEVAGGQIALKIGYLGTTATLTISGNDLITTVTGGSGADLAIDMTEYSTINDLAAFINSQTDYSASALNQAIGLRSPADLDDVSAIGIAAQFSAASKPGKVKLDFSDFEDTMNASALVEFLDGSSDDAGLPENVAKTFFAGGAKGATTAARFLAAVDAAEKIQDAAFFVPLFSRDASADILDKETDSGSTYTIAAIHSLSQAHCVKMSGVKARRERIAMLSIQAAYSDVKEASFNLASNRSELSFQQLRISDSQGNLKWFQPFMFATGIAGMQSGVSVPSRPVTFKTMAVSGVRQAASDFDAIAQAEDAIDAGLCFAQSIPGVGFRILLGNTTYLRSDGTAWFYSRLGVQYTADVLSKSLRAFLENNYIGLSNAELSAESVKNGLVSRLVDLKNQGILVGDDLNKGLGFRALIVSINGSVINVDVIVTIAEGIEFALVNINAARVSQTA